MDSSLNLNPTSADISQTTRRAQVFAFVKPSLDSKEPNNMNKEDENNSSEFNSFDSISPSCPVYNEQVKVIVMDKPTPKVIYEEPREPFRVQLGKSFSFLKSQTLQTINPLYTYLHEKLRPRLSPLRFALEVVICNLIMIISLPVILLWILVVLIARGVIVLYLRIRYKDKYKLMNGADAAWGIHWHANDNCFHNVFVVEGECSIEKIRERISQRLVEKTEIQGSKLKSTYLRMKERIVQKCGFFCWEQFPGFHINDHVKFVRNDPSAEMDEDDIFKEIQSTADSPLPCDLPQWDIRVIPRFNYRSSSNIMEELDLDCSIDTNYIRRQNTGGRRKGKKSHYALIWRINHSIMDGISAVHAVQYCIADNPVELSVDPLAPSTLKWYMKVGMFFQVLGLGSRSFIRSMIPKDSNCFHGPDLTGPKNFIWSRPFDIQAIKGIKNSMNCTTTAVFLSAVGGALKTLAEKKNLPLPDEIDGGATCAVFPYPDTGPRNRFTVAPFRLRLDCKCPKSRMENALEAANEVVNGAEVIKNFNMIRLTGLNPVGLIAKLMDTLQATFLLSNVPGPLKEYTLFNGDRLVDVTGWNTIKGRTAIGICLFSYAGKFRAGVIADSAVLPNPSDVSNFIQEFEREIVEVARVANIPEYRVFTEVS